ncbi:hypothetical protein [Nitrobacter sp. TKz-YC02]|uniref:hypothetical protein n=1 Tax=Nitrobacter sp. TKz-YC02 TaxID=3398704 RepID=UPI003CED3B02
MRFQTKQSDETAILIMRGDNTISGSIVRAGDQWRVEVLWGGPTGDIVYDAPSLETAKAFVDGVGEAFDAFEAMEGARDL